MPDLNFKSKNFIPSGVSVPLKKSISPILLTPNNDSIGSLHFKLKKKLEKNKLKKIINSLKKKLQYIEEINRIYQVIMLKKF